MIILPPVFTFSSRQERQQLNGPWHKPTHSPPIPPFHLSSLPSLHPSFHPAHCDLLLSLSLQQHPITRSYCISPSIISAPSPPLSGGFDTTVQTLLTRCFAAYLPSLLGLALLFCPHSPSFHVSSSHPTPPPPFRPQVRTIGWFRFIRREHPTSDEKSRPVQISRPCDTGYVHMGCNINPIKAMLSCKEHFWRP